MNVIDARLEVVAETSAARDVPGKVVAELELVLDGRLRRVDVVADRHAVRERLLRVAGPREDVIREVRGTGKTNSFSFDPVSTQLWFKLIELNVLSLSPQLSGTKRGAAA